MAQTEPSGRFLKSRQGLVLSLVLVAQAVLLYGFSRSETAPPLRPLKESPARYGAWQMVSEGVIEKEVLDVLKADDTVTRIYRQDQNGSLASLFVAYFKTQRTGQAPHSPKNCLPGAGWMPSTSDVLEIPVSGPEGTIRVNRYIVSRGDEKSVVLYWYQTPTRVIASEYEAKLYLVLDSIRYHRSDTALVRIVVPAVGGGEEMAIDAATDFVRSFFVPLRQYLPS
jgi:EpsI family protein